MEANTIDVFVDEDQLDRYAGALRLAIRSNERGAISENTRARIDELLRLQGIFAGIFGDIGLWLELEESPAGGAIKTRLRIQHTERLADFIAAFDASHDAHAA